MKDNFYYNLNSDNFLELFVIFKKYPKQFYKVIHNKRPFEKSKDMSYLRNWIYDSVQFLKDDKNEHRFAEYVYCILNNVISFPKCKTASCNNVCHLFINNRRGYSVHCSKECVFKDVTVYEKQAATNLKRYGNIFAADRKKISMTKREKAQSDPLYWKKQKDKARSTNVNRGRKPNWNNSEKAIASRRLKNNGKYRSDAELKKIEMTNIKKYGCRSSNQAQCVKEKKCCRSLENYGVKHYFQSDDFKTKNFVFYKKLGVTNCMQLYDVQIKTHKKYVFNGIKFDSKPELALYIWLTDNSFDFKFHPDINFQYEFNGKCHRYFPDFLISLSNVSYMLEVKGGMFFREDGTMFCPFRKKDWTDEQYAERCALEEVKRQCMLQNGVIIVKDTCLCIKNIIKNVCEKYGNSYLDKFRMA